MSDASTRGRTSRTKGRAFQSMIRDHLHDAGLRVIEEGGTGLAGGDLMLITRLGLLAVECKSGRTQLATDWKQTVEQAEGDDVPVLVHKRHGKAAPGEQWVTMSLDVFADLVGRRAER